jgi:hypothetical protein
MKNSGMLAKNPFFMFYCFGCFDVAGLKPSFLRVGFQPYAQAYQGL